MLICPQCQSENSDTNKFCESCGTSLTQKTCPECDHQVPLEAAHCHYCGAETGTVWWATITLRGPQRQTLNRRQTVAIVDDEDVTIPLFSVNDSLGSLTQNAAGKAELERMQGTVPPLPENLSETLPLDYLDPQQRYQLIQPLTPLANYPGEYAAQVLDRSPLQISWLQAVLNHSEQGLSSDLNLPSSASPLPIPPIAELYLALESDLYKTLPKIHDAWIEGQKMVVLLEERSHWPTLLAWWSDRQIPLPQVLYILDETVKLWSVLEPFGCRQSVLELQNLLVDEDEVISLKRLYLDPPGSTISLKDLGQLWQILFDQSQQTLLGSLATLVQEMRSGQIATLEALRGRLKAIDAELQGDAAEDMEAESDFDPLEIAAGIDYHLDSEAPTEIPEAFVNRLALGGSLTKLQLERGGERNSDILDDLPTVVLPMQLSSLDDCGATDTGRQRDRNEDSFCIQTQLDRLESKAGRNIHARGVYILCDGMGGHAGGEVASALAVDTLMYYFQKHWLEQPQLRNQLPDSTTIREAVRQANQAIYEMNQKQARTGSGRMGTTLVLLLVQDTNFAVTHVGDSRVYSYTRKQGLKVLTQDHDVGQREIQRGVSPDVAYDRPDAYQLTQALGPRNEDFVKPDIQYFEFNEDTLLILSSDGLTDNDLIEKHTTTHIAPLISSRANLERGVTDLIELANQHNGHDNITTIVVRAKVRPNLGHLRE